MTGPEHYREAERLLSAEARHVGPITVALAQAHATLALAAATAAGRFSHTSEDSTETYLYGDWQEVTS